jgi:membrane-associated phospholipid phosphatase
MVAMKRLFAIMVLLMPFVLFSQNIDIRILRAINSPEPLPSDGFFKAVSNSNIYISAGVPVTMAIAGLIGQDNELLRNAAVIAAGSVVNEGLKYAIKHTVNRDRPFVTYPDIVNKTGQAYDKDPSFPSGHTSSAFATATALSLAYPEWYVIAPSYLYAGTVAYSRMYLGVHYPSDVLAGAVIGSGCAWLSHVVNRKLNGQSGRHHE